MLPVLTSREFKEIDQRTCQMLGISEFELMERAAAGCTDQIIREINPDDRIAVVCGNGNNGGDGLAIAGLLRKNGYRVEVFITEGEKSPGCLHQLVKIDDHKRLSEFHLDEFHVIVDALLGTGASRPLDGEMLLLVEQINSSNAKVISVDIPSGIGADIILSSAIRADLTLVIGAHKLTAFLPETADSYGAIRLIDLYPPQLLEAYSNTAVMDAESIQKLVRTRKRFSHKGTYGHALLFAGSVGKAGAAILAARACLRSGVGLLTVETPKRCLLPIQISAPEAMVRLNGKHCLSKSVNLEGFDALGIRPGITTHKDVVSIIGKIIESEKPKVIDADALNILAQLPIQNLKNSILTPHPKEFSRLTGQEFRNSIERYETARQYALSHSCVLVLKDAVTMIFSPDGRVSINSTGNPGMTTGGMGDALTGIILGLLAQGYSLWDSARIGVYHHGTAGDVVAAQRGQFSLLPGDLIDALRIDVNSTS